MSGAVSILVAKGKQDAFLTENPGISFFRTNYQRHVNFSQCVHSQVIDGNPSSNSVSTITLTKKGDLVSYIYLTKKDNGVLQNNINSDDIHQVELLVGGQVVDKMTTDQLVSLRNMNFKYPQAARGSEDASGRLGFNDLYYYPLGFFFCEQWQCALPLISMQYHDVKIRITWGGAAVGDNVFYEAWANYIYLDNEERQFIAEKPRDMLIYQHQDMEAPNDTVAELMFNNPVSFLFAKVGSTDLFGDSGINVTNKLLLQINGVEITESKEVVPHYTSIPTAYHTVYGHWAKNDPITDVSVSTQVTWPYSVVTVTKELATNVSFLYPFCLNCAGIQPSGTCNFSRMDSVKLIATAPITKPVYARSFNILHIENGMGGILFSN